MRTRLPVRLKVAVVTAALTFAILCLFAIVIGAVAEQRIRDGFDDDLRATAADLQDNLSVEPDSSGRQALDRSDEEVLNAYSSGGAVVRIVNLTGGVVYPPGAAPLTGAQDGISHVGDLRVVSRQLVAPALEPRGTFDRIPRPVAEPVAYVQYAKPENSVELTVNKVRVFLAFGVFGGTVLAFLGGLYVARRAMRPIAGLTRAAREVARTRDPDVTLPKPRANDEVSDLAETLEDMLRELSAARGESEAALERQRDFVADASHELRTPLTSILANLELLEPELEGESRDMAGSALRSSRRMRRLVADLLLLARADAGRQAPRLALDLAVVAAEATIEADPLAAGHTLTLDAPEPVPVLGVADDLHRLMANLIENALIHTAPGTPVTVSIRATGGSAVVVVEDRGPGIPEPMRERIFERFARGGGDSAGGGSGLGLAIVRAVAEAHAGRVEVLDAPGGGARFVITLPLAGDATTPEAAEPPAAADRV